jgi:membrane protease YdiL (CAAX protease family)
LPAIQIWVALLGINLVYGLTSRFSDSSSPVNEVVVTVVAAASVLGFCSTDVRRLRPLLRRWGIDRRTWRLPVAVVVLLPVFLELYFWAVGMLVTSDVGYLDDYVTHGWPLWTAFLLISVCPAIFEELAFRGFIMNRLRPVMSDSETILVQAAMFSVLHMMPLIFVSHFVFGLAFGLLRQRTRSLYPGMVIHMLWNAWVLVGKIT